MKSRMIGCALAARGSAAGALPRPTRRPAGYFDFMSAPPAYRGVAARRLRVPVGHPAAIAGELGYHTRTRARGREASGATLIPWVPQLRSVTIPLTGVGPLSEELGDR